MIDLNMSGVEITDRGPYTGTWSRRRFYPLDPRPDEVDIMDIAVGLSKQCRFNGHIDRFYSVAEHSVIASTLSTDPRIAKWLLMHDAPEAYIGDMVRPLKAVIPQFQEIEDRIMSVIAEKFGLDGKMPAEVKAIDNIMCSTEKRDLIPGSETWPNMPPAIPTFEITEREVLPEEARLMRHYVSSAPSARGSMK